MEGRWFSLSTPVSSTNKTDRHDITEILLKVALNIITQPNTISDGRERFTLMVKCSWYNIIMIKVCQWFAADLCFALGTLFSSTNETDYHDITEILLKVALNTNYSKLYQTTCWGPFHIHIKVNLNKIKHLWNLYISLVIDLQLTSFSMGLCQDAYFQPRDVF